MCLIIDANRLSWAFSDEPPEDARPLLKWLLHGDGRVVYDEAFQQELGRVKSAHRVFLELTRSGRARFIKQVPTTPHLEFQSNDGHIIYLARASGARIVCTLDRDLMQDVRNRSLLDGPRGRIYQRIEHKALLHHDSSCSLPR